MSTSIPSPLVPEKDPPSPSVRSASLAPNKASSAMPPPPRPQISSTSTSSIPLATERPPFAPFFTLINDVSTQSTHHPSRIHYIFSDDDESEVLPEACIRSLAQGADEGEGESAGGLEKGKEVERREERVLIVDVNATGDGILSTSSLSASWQVISAEIASAPTFNNEGTEDDSERGLMLRIEGVGIGESDDLGDSAKVKGVTESGMGEDEMQALLEGFDRNMGVLRSIVKAGERWNESRREKPAGLEEAEAVREV